METILLVTVLAGTLALLGFSAVLLRRVSGAAQVDVKGTFASRSQTASSKGFQRFGARLNCNWRRAGKSKTGA
jgi:hypothetical protein